MAHPIQYPILCFSQGTIVSMPSREKFVTCSTVEFKRGWYRDLFLVDSAGRGYRIEGARPVGYAGPLWGFRLFRRMIRVKLNLKKGPFDVPLDALKKRILEAVNDDEAYWTDVADVNDIKRAVKDAPTHEEVISLPFWAE